jgi:RNA polymerase sigma-70 factor, ECF subfamily
MSGLGAPRSPDPRRAIASAAGEPSGGEAYLGLAAEVAGAERFEFFFETESRTLFRRLWLVTGNRAEAEEIMQDAFLRLWERWDRVQHVDDPTAYLYRTAMNVFRRRHQRAVIVLKRAVGAAPRPDEFALADERHLVRRVLAELSPRQRAALVLTEMLGFSAKEAARSLGVSASTVRALAFQGRAAFKKIMERIDE